jgi:hypothetical protein
MARGPGADKGRTRPASDRRPRPRKCSPIWTGFGSSPTPRPSVFRMDPCAGPGFCPVRFIQTRGRGMGRSVGDDLTSPSIVRAKLGSNLEIVFSRGQIRYLEIVPEMRFAKGPLRPAPSPPPSRNFRHNPKSSPILANRHGSTSPSAGGMYDVHLRRRRRTRPGREGRALPRRRHFPALGPPPPLLVRPSPPPPPPHPHFPRWPRSFSCPARPRVATILSPRWLIHRWARTMTQSRAIHAFEGLNELRPYRIFDHAQPMNNVDRRIMEVGLFCCSHH